MKNIIVVAGARPNFVKIAPLMYELNKQENRRFFSTKLIHTGQHYDEKMSDSFFAQLKIPKPDLNLGVGSGTHAQQTASIMVKFEEVLMQSQTDLVIVVGDVNSTLACTIVAKKLNVKVAHIEAGLRSYDMSMPEEINRIVTDSLADLFFTTTTQAGQNLNELGVHDDKIHFVGNIMIDSLVSNIQDFKKPEAISKNAGAPYALLTMHRPSNVDSQDRLQRILEVISTELNDLNIYFPIHPRTRKNIQALEISSKIILLDPLPYLEFMYLVKNTQLVITDSGGIQEETTYLGKPCITIRANTERPETIDIGTNELARSEEELERFLKKFESGEWKKGNIPPLWDGSTAQRIVSKLKDTI